MGEIADAIINGDLCEGCGIAFPSSGDGYPRKCGGCKREEREAAKKKGEKNGNTK